MKTDIKELTEEKPKRRGRRKAPLISLMVLIIAATPLLMFLSSATLKEIAIKLYRFKDPLEHLSLKDSAELVKYRLATEKKVASLQKRIATLIPVGPYMIINTTKNSFVLRTRGKVILEGICSTGSYTLLEGNDGKKWFFKTPKGQFRILNKVKDPVWIKPDWAFVEDGLPIPPRNHPDRYEYGTLGDYALSLGQGYLIHGTLYQRFLGLPVTHGCIRLGDKDLETVYKNLDIGSRVYIY